jgi:hypothetical protein
MHAGVMGTLSRDGHISSVAEDTGKGHPSPSEYSSPLVDVIWRAMIDEALA